MKKFRLFSLVLIVGLGFALSYYQGARDALDGETAGVIENAHAAASNGILSSTDSNADKSDYGKPSPNKPMKNRDVYYPGTEELGPKEIRVIACGSGMPMPRLKQAAPCFLIELGNNDKFIFDIGTGSMERLYALGIPLDYIDKVFLTHLHMDHMGDLPAFYIYGPQNNRSVPLRVWGPGGGGTRPEWGTKADVEDGAAFDRYMAVIEKIPLIDSAMAREEIRKQLEKEVHEFSEQCAEKIKTVRPNLKMESIFRYGSSIADFRTLMSDYKIDLLILNTNDESQLAMHGMAYSIAVEFTDFPLLLL